jgi:hypothetical protein
MMKKLFLRSIKLVVRLEKSSGTMKKVFLRRESPFYCLKILTSD